MSGVAQRHPVPMVPALVPHSPKVAPHGAVREQTVALELLAEQRLAEGERRTLVGAIQPRRTPGRFGGFNDERRAFRLVLVGVDSPQAVLVALEVEGECGEGAGRSEPDVAIATPIHGRLEAIGKLPAYNAVEAIGGDHDVRSQEPTDVRYLGGDLDP